MVDIMSYSGLAGVSGVECTTFQNIYIYKYVYGWH